MWHTDLSVLTNSYRCVSLLQTRHEIVLLQTKNSCAAQIAQVWSLHPLAGTDLASVSVASPFTEYYIDGLTQHVVFGTGLFFYLAKCTGSSSIFLLLSFLCHCVDAPWFVRSPVDGHLGCFQQVFLEFVSFDLALCRLSKSDDKRKLRSIIVSPSFGQHQNN